MSLIFKTPWTKQPQVATPLSNKSSVKWDLLINPAAINPSNNNIEPVSSGVLAPRQSGVCLSPSGSTNDGWRTTQNYDAINGATTLTVVAEFVARTTTTGVILGRWGTAANFGGMLVSFNTNAVAFYVASSSTSIRAQRSTVITAGKTHRFVGVWRGGGTMELYLDGAACPPSSILIGNPSAIQSASERLYFCRHADAASGDTGSGVAVSLAGISMSAISARQAQALSANPWQLFAPLPSRIWVPGAASGSQSESGGSSASVVVTAVGAGTAVEGESGGSSASVVVTAVGAGSALEAVSGGSSASVVVSAVGAGSALEIVSDGSSANTAVTALGAGVELETVSGGSSTSVVVTAVGAGLSSEDTGVGVYPSPATVLAGVQYGPSGVEYIGTMDLLTAAEAAEAVAEYTYPSGLTLEQLVRNIMSLIIVRT